MTISAILEQDRSADRRSLSRRKLNLATSLEASGQHVSIHDISSTGMLIETAAELAPDDDFEIDLPQSGATRALVVWNSGPFFGCEFIEPLSRASISAALLRSLPPGAPSLPLPLATNRVDRLIADLAQEDGPVEELKAPLGVRLRLIFASAILLWALIISGTILLLRIFG